MSSRPFRSQLGSTVPADVGVSEWSGLMTVPANVKLVYLIMHRPNTSIRTVNAEVNKVNVANGGGTIPVTWASSEFYQWARKCSSPLFGGGPTKGVRYPDKSWVAAASYAGVRFTAVTLMACKVPLVDWETVLAEAHVPVSKSGLLDMQALSPEVLTRIDPMLRSPQEMDAENMGTCWKLTKFAFLDLQDRNPDIFNKWLGDQDTNSGRINNVLHNYVKNNPKGRRSRSNKKKGSALRGHKGNGTSSRFQAVLGSMGLSSSDFGGFRPRASSPSNGSSSSSQRPIINNIHHDEDNYLQQVAMHWAGQNRSRRGSSRARVRPSASELHQPVTPRISDGELPAVPVPQQRAAALEIETEDQLSVNRNAGGLIPEVVVEAASITAVEQLLRSRVWHNI